jgi:UDP-N-acetylglucosamine 4,6-dehydratase
VLAKAILELMGKPNHPVHVMGTRHGEKLYEALLSREEMACAQDMGEYFRIPPDGRDLNYSKFVEHGELRLNQTTHDDDYNSHNTSRLNLQGMKQMLLKLDFMQRIARGEHAVAEE